MRGHECDDPGDRPVRNDIQHRSKVIEGSLINLGTDLLLCLAINDSGQSFLFSPAFDPNLVLLDSEAIPISPSSFFVIVSENLTRTGSGGERRFKAGTIPAGGTPNPMLASVVLFVNVIRKPSVDRIKQKRVSQDRTSAVYHSHASPAGCVGEFAKPYHSCWADTCLQIADQRRR
jgi:hypothetical protein